MNGKMVPELIEGYVDLPFMKILDDAIKHNDRTLLVGHCGVGKTSSIEQLAARGNYELRRTNLNGQTTISDLMGQWIAKGGEIVWIDGIVPQAMKKGQWLILDEIDFAPPEILSCIHGILEDDGYLVLAEKDGEVVRPEKGFRVFGTANSIGANVEERGLYQGTQVMNEAFLDRWSTVLKVLFPPPELEVSILMKRIPGLPASTATLVVRVANEFRELFKKGEIYTTFSPRKCLQWADKIMRYGDFLRAAKVTVLNKLSDEEFIVADGIFNRWCKEG